MTSHIWNGKIIKSCLKPPTSHQLRFFKKTGRISEIWSADPPVSAAILHNIQPPNIQKLCEKGQADPISSQILGLLQTILQPLPLHQPPLAHGQGAACQARPSWSLMPALKAPNLHHETLPVTSDSTGMHDSDLLCLLPPRLGCWIWTQIPNPSPDLTKIMDWKMCSLQQTWFLAAWVSDA